jgi:hypothetical protein
MEFAKIWREGVLSILYCNVCCIIYIFFKFHNIVMIVGDSYKWNKKLYFSRRLCTVYVCTYRETGITRRLLFNFFQRTPAKSAEKH